MSYRTTRHGEQYTSALRRRISPRRNRRLRNHLLHPLQSFVRLLPKLRHQSPRSRLRRHRPTTRLAHASIATRRRTQHQPVSPSHVVAQILEALLLAAQAGLRIPLVFNSGGYDALPTLRLVEGIVDIYMPDAKYGDPEVGQRLSRVDDYPTVNRQAILEMHRQVGPLTLDASGIATRGLLVRHLVLPASLADSRTILRFLAQHVSTTTYVHIMDEYRPCFLASDHEQLARPLRRSEYEFVMQVAREEGLEPR